MNNRIYMRGDGIYQQHPLHESEIALLKILEYLQDKEHGCGNEDHFDNLMMDTFYISNTVEKLLTKVNHNYDAISCEVRL